MFTKLVSFQTHTYHFVGNDNGENNETIGNDGNDENVKANWIDGSSASRMLLSIAANQLSPQNHHHHHHHHQYPHQHLETRRPKTNVIFSLRRQHTNPELLSLVVVVLLLSLQVRMMTTMMMKMMIMMMMTALVLV